MSNQNKWLIGIIAGTLLVCGCLSIVCLAAGGLAVYQFADPSQGGTIFEVTQEAIPVRPTQVRKTPVATQPEVTATPWASDNPTPQSPQTLEGAQQTLNTLENHEIPVNDPRELAGRLEGKKDIPETMSGTPPTYKPGDQQTFWASNTDDNSNFEVEATLRYATPHLYFWIENGVDYNQGDLKQLCETFESKIYPTDRDFFGSEWTPGIDNDPHLYILYVRNVGSTTAGYFSSADEYHPDAHKYSNAHEMFVLNADSVSLGEEYIYSTVAHEFQHMIHWYLDRNEESWVNEGFSELAQLLNGYGTGGLDRAFAADPDLQLTYWPSSPDSAPHYGASFLFWAYFLDRFGDKATQAVVANTDNGMDSIDTVLKTINANDPKTGQLIQADDVFADWAVTNYLNDARVEDGRYVYKRYAEAPTVQATQEENRCASDWQTATVNQFGADYIKINCSGNVTLQFEGATEVGVLPASAYSGDYTFWSNRADESNMTLTRTFDFTSASGPLTFNYRAWWELEEDYDYLYLAASDDDGSTWQILNTPSGRDRSDDPSGNAYGWGYNGQSGDWVEETIDLSAFAGKKVQLRFEYVTDAAVNENGFLLDDVQIPEIKYQDDFEQGDGGWEGKGFVRIENRLPQQFRLSVIRDGKTITVETVTLDAGQTASIPLQFDADLRDAVLVISGVTRFTTQPANYRLRFEK